MRWLCTLYLLLEKFLLAASGAHGVACIYRDHRFLRIAWSLAMALTIFIFSRFYVAVPFARLKWSRRMRSDSAVLRHCYFENDGDGCGGAGDLRPPAQWGRFARHFCSSTGRTRRPGAPVARRCPPSHPPPIHRTPTMGCSCSCSNCYDGQDNQSREGFGLRPQYKRMKRCWKQTGQGEGGGGAEGAGWGAVPALAHTAARPGLAPQEEPLRPAPRAGEFGAQLVRHSKDHQVIVDMWLDGMKFTDLVGALARLIIVARGWGVRDT